MGATGSRQDLRQASESLTMLRQSVEALHNSYQTIVLMVLQSLALNRLGGADEALDILRQAIQLAKPGGWVYPFVESGPPMAELLERLTHQNGAGDYPRRVLDQFPRPGRSPPDTAAANPRDLIGHDAGLTEPLTRREVDVLELLAQRLQTKEIATRLFVSPETVKTHLKNLYQKLGVKNRREASVKAAAMVARRGDT
jgi:LuxR family maltose regulon positive regulatory protein